MKRPTERDKHFIQGACCAVASMVYALGSSTQSREALEACGIRSIKDMRRHDVCDYDIDLLRECIREIQIKERRQK